MNQGSRKDIEGGKVMIAILIIGTLLSMAMLVYGIVLVNKNERRGAMLVLFGTILTGIGIGTTIAEIQSIPKAIDVYRGKTTLEITYRDSVAVDSVVVYKMK